MKEAKTTLFSFTGRIGRSTFWVIFVTFFLIGVGLQIVGTLSGDRVGFGWLVALALIYFIPAIWISLAAYVKRWHDLNRSGWLALTLFIPYVNLLILLYLGIAPGTEGINKYGEEPP